VKFVASDGDVFLEIQTLRRAEANVIERVRGGKRARTKEKLIAAAAAVIGEKGYDRASLQEIAARTGITRGAVYGNFKNKEKIFLALIASHEKPIVQAPSQPQGAIAHFRRDGRPSGTGSSKSGCRDGISALRADARADAVPSYETERGYLSAHGEGTTEGGINERAAHASREVCLRTGCDDYRLALHVFSNAGTDNRRHYHRCI
jgi:hypothetical protein